MTMPILYLIIVWIGNILQKKYLDLIKSEGLVLLLLFFVFLQKSQKLNYAFKCGQIGVKSCMHNLEIPFYKKIEKISLILSASR